MDGCTTKTITTSRGMVYQYQHSQPQNSTSQTPAAIFLHGFRDTATVWQYMLPHLQQLPLQLFFLDLLGHGASSKPTDPESYAYHLMVHDILDLLDTEHLPRAILIGHDHGAGLAQRIYNHAPSRVSSLILLNVPYSPPNFTTPFDLPSFNAQSHRIFGYGVLEYWYFLTSPAAPSLLSSNLDRAFDYGHAATFEGMRDIYCVPDALRTYLTDSSIPKIELREYAQNPELREEWKRVFGKGGFAAPLNWYIAHTAGVQFQSDQKVKKEDLVVRVPVLFIGCEEDAVCREEGIQGPKEDGLLPDLKVESLKGVGHFPMYEEPERTAGMIGAFLGEKGLLGKV